MSNKISPGYLYLRTPFDENLKPKMILLLSSKVGMAVHFPFVSYRECLFMDRQACCQMKLYRADYGESAFDLQGFGEGPIVSMHGKDIRQFSFGIVEIAKNILQFPHKSSGIKKVRKSGFAAVYPWG